MARRAVYYCLQNLPIFQYGKAVVPLCLYTGEEKRLRDFVGADLASGISGCQPDKKLVHLGRKNDRFVAQMSPNYEGRDVGHLRHDAGPAFLLHLGFRQ